jgi:hypothetical protein
VTRYLTLSPVLSFLVLTCLILTFVLRVGEWSLQMNNHLRGFYPEEAAKSKSDLFSSPISQTSASGHSESPADIENRIHLLQKKLLEYERRKQKLLLEETKNQAAAESASGKDQLTLPATSKHLDYDTHSQGSQQTGNLTIGLSAGNESGNANGPSTSSLVNSTGTSGSTSIGPGNNASATLANVITDSIMSQSQLNATPNSTLVNNWSNMTGSNFGNGAAKLEFLGPTNFGFSGCLDHTDSTGLSGNNHEELGRTQSSSSSSNPPIHPALKGRVSSAANLNQTAGSNPGDQLITSPLFSNTFNSDSEQTAANQTLMALNKSLQSIVSLEFIFFWSNLFKAPIFTQFIQRF